jgi:hypothetical protein
MSMKVTEWVMYGPVEVQVTAEADPHTNEIVDGPYCALTGDLLCRDVANDLFKKPFLALDTEATKRVNNIVLGIEELSQFHRFSGAALDQARDTWEERGGQ